MKQSLKLIAGFLIIIWVSYFASLFLPINQWGLVPRTIPGLIGIITAPLLHGSLAHLIGNSISFTIFAVIFASLEGNKMLVKTILMTLLTGTLTWLMARSALHIGASGLIFSLLGYLLLSGWFSKRLKYILVSIVLMFLYSSMIFGILPGQASISWESHLFGFISGILVAWFYHKKSMS